MPYPHDRIKKCIVSFCKGKQAGAKRLEFEIVVVLQGSILFKKEREASAEKKILGQRFFVHLLVFGGWARKKRK